MYKREYELIMNAVLINKDESEIKHIDELLTGPIDWIEVAGQLFNNRLAGYFFYGLNNRQLKALPSELREVLNLLVLIQKKETTEKLEAIAPVLDELENCDVHYSALKGMQFNASMYNIGARRSNDIDVLVYENDLDEFDRIMRKFGFIQTFNKEGELVESSRKEKLIQRMNYHDLVPYVLKNDDICLVIDVNFLYDSKENLIDKRIFDYGTRTYDNGSFSTRGLHIYTNLAFLCIHFHREGTNSLWTEYNRDMSLYKIVDIMNTIRKYKHDIVIDEWICLVKDFKLEKKCYYTFNILSQFYNDDFVSEVERKLRPEDIHFIDEIAVEGKKQIIKREDKFIDTAFKYLHS